MLLSMCYFIYYLLWGAGKYLYIVLVYSLLFEVFDSVPSYAPIELLLVCKYETQINICVKKKVTK